MLLRNVFLKTLRDQRRGMVWWSVGLALYAGLMAAFYPSITNNDALQDYVESFPEDLLAVMGIQDVTDFTTPAGYLNAEVFGIMAPILFLVFAVALGANTIGGEQEKGTMELLLSEPVARGKLVLEKFASMAAATTVLGLILWLALALGGAVVGMNVSLLRLAEATISVTLLGLSFGAVAFATGCVTGSRGVSVGVAASAAFVTYVLNVISRFVDFVGPGKWASPFFYYNDAAPILNGLNPAHAGFLLGLILVLAGVSYVGFQRCDVRN